MSLGHDEDHDALAQTEWVDHFTGPLCGLWWGKGQARAGRYAKGMKLLIRHAYRGGDRSWQMRRYEHNQMAGRNRRWRAGGLSWGVDQVEQIHPVFPLLFWLSSTAGHRPHAHPFQDVLHTYGILTTDTIFVYLGLSFCFAYPICGNSWINESTPAMGWEGLGDGGSWTSYLFFLRFFKAKVWSSHLRWTVQNWFSHFQTHKLVCGRQQWRIGMILQCGCKHLHSFVFDRYSGICE